MSKITLTNLVNLQNETTAVTAINANSAALTTAFDNTVSRDGTSPNTMSASLDMNGQRILNLPLPSNGNEPARLTDISGLGYVTGFTGTSTTSVLIGLGSKSFTASTGKLWSVGQFILFTSAASALNYMHGTVTSYSTLTGALVVNVVGIGGSGTFADWNIGLAGAPGATGPSGAVGLTGTPSANQFATFANATTVQGLSLTGLVKGNGASAPTAATANTDYLTPPSGTAILKANSSGALANASAGTDYLAPAAIGTTVQAFDAQLFSNLPANSQSAAYGLVAADAEKFILHPSADTTARVWTIPANASVAYPVGTAITFVNQNAGGVITISITTDTMRLAGAGTTGSRTLAANGVATALKITTTEWIISGSGLT